MRIKYFLLLICITLFQFGNAQVNTDLMFNGIYRWVDQESKMGIAENIRFYEDGFVINQITAGKGEYKDASNFNILNYPRISYSVNKDKVTFSTITKDSIRIEYVGQINKKELLVTVNRFNKNNELIQKEASRNFLFIEVTGLNSYSEKEKNYQDKIERKKFDIINEDFFLVVEEMPEFPGGIEKEKDFIIENLIYPEDLKKEKVEATVYLTFIVEKNGTITNIEILKSPNQSFTLEATKVIEKMPIWNAGKQKGQPVRVMLTRPIKFKIK